MPSGRSSASTERMTDLPACSTSENCWICSEVMFDGEDQMLFSKMATQGRVLTLPDVLYSYRYHQNNATLFNGLRAVGENHSNNGHSLAAFYMLGAMRLWAGEPPRLLQPMLEKNSFKWNVKSFTIFLSAVWGHVSPLTLKLFLRGSIRLRDLLASAIIKDGKPYEWRSE